MIEKNNPQIDVDQLLALVQAELDRQRRQQAETAGSAQTDALEQESNNPYQWTQLSATLDIAQQNADAGSRLSTMLHYRKAVRLVARAVGKVILYFGRVITVPQRDFNNAILHALRITLNGIRDMNRFTDQSVRRIDSRMEREGRVNQDRLDALERQLTEQSHQLDYLRSTLVMQERRIAALLDQARACLPEPFDQEQVAAFVQQEGQLLDPLYVSFEDKFRGTREEIKARLAVYLPRLDETSAGREDRPILDIGSGRGEWLELLAENGLTAQGVDVNESLAAQCRQRGYTVTVQDGLDYLRSLPDSSLGAITGFHLVEHLPMAVQLELYGECVRVLKSGGMAIFETPNPQNLLVGACNFWADPTHKRPLYPETQQFFMEYRGFGRVELQYLHPHDAAHQLPQAEAPQLAARLNDLLSCARDYAVIGYRP